MITIYKYEVEIKDGVQPIEIPGGAEVLNVKCLREGFLSFWVLVNPSMKKEVRNFFVVGTGEKGSCKSPLRQAKMKDFYVTSTTAGLVYHGTGVYFDELVTMHMVWHLFEERG